MLKPIPNSLTQCIRSFSKNLEGWLNAALNDVVPEELKAIKVIFALFFASTLTLHFYSLYRSLPCDLWRKLCVGTLD